MSISTDITRLQNAKAAIKTAIEGKGVTVPDATLLDGMAALIDSIEAGGGGIEYTTGTKILTTNGNMINYEGRFDLSELSTKPNLFIVYSELETTTEYSKNKGLWVGIHILNSDNSTIEFIFAYNGGTSKYFTPYVSKSTTGGNYTGNISQWHFVAGANVPLLADVTYRYHAFVGV